MRFFWLLVMGFPSLGWSQPSLEVQKSATVEIVLAGCSDSLLKPNLQRFMEKARAAGKPFPDEKSAIAAIEKSQVAMEKDPFYKSELKPAVLAACKCAAGGLIEKIKASKDQAQMEAAVKSSKPPSGQQMQECTSKHLQPAMKKMNSRGT